MKKRRRVDITLHPKSHLNGILQRNVKDKPSRSIKRGISSALRTMGHAATVPVLKGSHAIKSGLQNTRSHLKGEDENLMQDGLQYYKPQLNIVGPDGVQLIHKDEQDIEKGYPSRLDKQRKSKDEGRKKKGIPSGQAQNSGEGMPLASNRFILSDSLAMPMQDVLEPALPRVNKKPLGNAKARPRGIFAEVFSRNTKVLSILFMLAGVTAVAVFGWYMLFGRYSVVSVNDDGVLKAVRTKEATIEQMLAVASYTLTPEDLISVPMQQKPKEGLVVNITRARNITIKADGQTISVRLATGTIQDAIAKSGVTVGENDAVTPAPTTQIQADVGVQIIRAKTVYIKTKSKKIKVMIATGTVKDVLKKAGLTYDSHDVISPSLSSAISEGMEIDFQAVEIKTVSHKQTVEYETVRKNSDKYYYGTTKVSQTGKNGTRTITEEVTYRDGIEISRKTVSSKITTAPVDKIILIGCKPTLNPDIVGLPKGGPNSSMIKSTVTMAQITAYTHSGKRTATGKWPKVGMCAIDRRVFSYGTLFYVPGYGYCVAEDTGSGVGDAYSMDLFMDTQTQCNAWGRKRNVTVYVLYR